MNLPHPVVIIGVDPGMAKNKPVAAAALLFKDGVITVFVCAPFDLEDSPLLHKLTTWEYTVRIIVDIVLTVLKDDSMTIHLAVEDARGVGGRGWTLQALVAHLKELARPVDHKLPLPVEGLDSAMVIKPAEIKKAVTGQGNASAETVAMFVNAHVQNPEQIPDSAGYDYHAACATAITGYTMLCEEYLLKSVP
jgi:hypothetical protein